MSDVKRWETMVTVPVNAFVPGTTAFTWEPCEVVAASDYDALAARLATKQADLHRALIAMVEAQELNSQWRKDWKELQAKLKEAQQLLRAIADDDYRVVSQQTILRQVDAWLAGAQGSAGGSQT